MKRSVVGIFVYLLVLVLAVGCGGGASTPTPTQPAQSTPTSEDPQGSEWDAVIAAAKQEGVVVDSPPAAPQDDVVEIARKFEETYGIRVEFAPLRYGDFMARYQAELSTNKVSVDVRSGGIPECWGLERDMAGQDPTVPFGSLPAVSEYSDWIIDPLTEVKAGTSNAVLYAISGYYLIVHTDHVAEEDIPQTYKDLEDPKYRGQILLDEPRGASPGIRYVAYARSEYGDDHVRKVFDNVAALSRSSAEGPRQVARGEYGIYVHATQSSLVGLLDFPEPRPFKIVVPKDGQMAIQSGMCIVKGAPHPNAAKLWANFRLTHEAQSISASYPGGAFLRRDVTPVDTTLAPFLNPDFKLFPGNPSTWEFVNGTGQYYTLGEGLNDYLRQLGIMQ